jgi:hypothetical protein
MEFLLRLSNWVVDPAHRDALQTVQIVLEIIAYFGGACATLWAAIRTYQDYSDSSENYSERQKMR